MDISSWTIAAAGECGIAFIALKVLWILTLATVKRRKDPLRRLPFLWLKWAISLFILFLFLRIVVLILTIVFEVYDSTGLVLEIIDHLTVIDSFFSSVADAVILLCLVELALSFLGALGNDSTYHRIIRYSNLVAISVLFVLAVAALGENESWLINSDYGRLRVSKTTPSNLYAAYNIIYWIASIAAVFLSSFVLYSSVQKKRMRGLTRRFLAASLLNLLRYTWELYYTIRYLINYNRSTIIPQYTVVIGPVLYTWVTVSIFGLLFAIGFKKKGLWSQQQLPQQQGIAVDNSAGGAFSSVQGQGLPPSPAYVLYQQPAQAELSGHAPPPWRPELPGYPNPNQQYYWAQYQQQGPVVQNQTQYAVEVAGEPYGSLPTNLSPNRGRLPTQQEPQVTQLYEVPGTLDQKT